MRIIVVDDSDVKLGEVTKVLKANLNVQENQIVFAKSYNSALMMLNTTFDLMILDLCLPMRDGEQPNDDIGMRMLSEIYQTDHLKTPSHVICLTEYDRCVQAFNDDARKHLYHIVTYSPINDEWKNSLAIKARFIKKSVDQTLIPDLEYNKDILIVNSSPHVELTEILKLEKFETGEFSQQDNVHYFPGSWNCKDGRVISIVACAAPSMGMVAACATAMKGIARWKPKFVIMTGIAAGVVKDSNFGDVLIALEAFDYGSGKIKEDKSKKRSFMPNPNYLSVDAKLQAILQKYEREQTFMNEIYLQWHTRSKTMLKLFMGPFASGAAVVQSPELISTILANSRKVIGIDMEAYAIFSAARLAPLPQPRVLVVKSISDFADSKKKDDWQQYAAFTSASFVYRLFTEDSEIWN